MKGIRHFINQRFQKWLASRLKPSDKVLLNQRNVYIFPTGQGLVFGIMLFALFLAGVNYGNSLLLGTSFLLASLFLVSILHTYRNLSGLTLVAGKTENCFAGSRGMFELQIEKKPQRRYESILFYSRDENVGSADLLEQHQRPLEIMLVAKRRGVMPMGRLKLETKYPLGLLRAWSWVEMQRSCLVYPKPLENRFVPAGIATGVKGEKIIPFGVEDFYELQSYRAGDSLNRIDWKAYAKSDDLYTKQFIDYSSADTWIDWYAIPEADPELKLSYLCYWVLKLDEKRLPFGLRMPGVELNPALGEEHKFKCLKQLALFNS